MNKLRFSHFKKASLYLFLVYLLAVIASGTWISLALIIHSEMYPNSYFMLFEVSDTLRYILPAAASYTIITIFYLKKVIGSKWIKLSTAIACISAPLGIALPYLFPSPDFFSSVPAVISIFVALLPWNLLRPLEFLTLPMVIAAGLLILLFVLRRRRISNQ